MPSAVTLVIGGSAPLLRTGTSSDARYWVCPVHERNEPVVWKLIYVNQVGQHLCDELPACVGVLRYIAVGVEALHAGGFILVGEEARANDGVVQARALQVLIGGTFGQHIVVERLLLVAGVHERGCESHHQVAGLLAARVAAPIEAIAASRLMA